VQNDNEITGTNDSVALPLNNVSTAGGPFGRIKQYWHDVRLELKRVSWPSLEHVRATTLITLAAVVFFTIYLYVVDQAIVWFGRFLNWSLSQLGIL
jgi:preprotein translocase SecE subunit